MRLIDLTLPITDGMPVYPGDPPVRFRRTRHLHESCWRLHEISMGSHTGTHVNAPWHMADNGARLEDLPLAGFVSQAVVRGNGLYRTGMGLIYVNGPLDRDELPLVLSVKPAFVAVSVVYPLEVDVERELCQAGVISFENLVNTKLLPHGEPFLFMGLPLAITGDGAPVRAVAMVGHA